MHVDFILEYYNERAFFLFYFITRLTHTRARARTHTHDRTPPGDGSIMLLLFKMINFHPENCLCAQCYIVTGATDEKP